MSTDGRMRLRVRSKAGGVLNTTAGYTDPFIYFARSLEDSTTIPWNMQKLEESTTPGIVFTPAFQPTPPTTTTQTSQPNSTQSISAPPYTFPAPAAKGSLQLVTDGGVVRRKIDDDNSCLFNAIGYVIESDKHGKAKPLRSLVAFIVKNSEEYDEAVLGKSKNEYASWITQPNSWGGGIEVAILAEQYRTEICTFDVLTKIPYCYGEGQGYTQRVYLVYDGIHYDALAINLMAEEGAPSELDITIFSPGDTIVNSKMAAYVASLNKAGQFTNMATFQLICGDCNKVLTGEKEMALHAAATGHGRFEEIKK